MVLGHVNRSQSKEQAAFYHGDIEDIQAKVFAGPSISPMVEHAATKGNGSMERAVEAQPGHMQSREQPLAESGK
ncbi:hypothetical protein CRG98_037837 [Punica granatum]|uniref:Uncharacterized protein n=1 Tax=Punica granatum TaxID=22663 RepID=A0A2I0ICR6_PUNGR|nr:hypothetical protein CRG98_037837 [Punica granatum]